MNQTKINIANQSDWEVLLKGNAQDLRSITEYYGSTDYFRIWGGIDDWNDCRNDHFSFNSVFFENENDINSIWQISYEILSLFNGATELFFKNAEKLSIGSINLNGIPTAFQENSFSSGLLGIPSGGIPKREMEIEKVVPTFPRMILLILATENEDVYMILKYLDLDRSWSNYYRLMETIESHIGIKKISVRHDKSTRTRFTNTANNYSLAGFDSRHGFKQNIKANKTAGMSISEAHKYITDLCKDYLVAAYPKYFKRAS